MKNEEWGCATLRFIQEHSEDDVKTLALKAHGLEGVDLPYALDQIEGRQTARRKLPSWAAVDSIVYPPHISMEQCSSEQTALYKKSVLDRLNWLSLRSPNDVSSFYILHFLRASSTHFLNSSYITTHSSPVNTLERQRRCPTPTCNSSRNI